MARSERVPSNRQARVTLPHPTVMDTYLYLALHSNPRPNANPALTMLRVVHDKCIELPNTLRVGPLARMMAGLATLSSIKIINKAKFHPGPHTFKDTSHGKTLFPPLVAPSSSPSRIFCLHSRTTTHRWRPKPNTGNPPLSPPCPTHPNLARHRILWRPYPSSCDNFSPFHLPFHLHNLSNGQVRE